MTPNHHSQHINQVLGILSPGTLVLVPQVSPFLIHPTKRLPGALVAAGAEVTVTVTTDAVHVPAFELLPGNEGVRLVSDTAGILVTVGKGAGTLGRREEEDVPVQ
ncbi:MAG: hypothetical protein M1830_005823, partial [Pleopsidium flavum]